MLLRLDLGTCQGDLVNKLPLFHYSCFSDLQDKPAPVSSSGFQVPAESARTFYNCIQGMQKQGMLNVFSKTPTIAAYEADLQV